MSETVDLTLFAVLTLVLLAFLTRSDRAKEALQLVVSAPGFLVPAAMVAMLVTFLAHQDISANTNENPWGSPLGPPGFINWILLGITAFAIAGQIGLLEASARGLRPGSDAFIGGIRQHVGTILVGKLLLSLMTYVLLLMFAPQGLGNVIYIAPSILLAPLIGMASKHPGRPVRSLKETLSFAQENMSSVARLVTGQALFLFGLFYIHEQVLDGHHSITLLGHSNSVLSYNPFPYALMQETPFYTISMVALSAFASTVFVTAHWLGMHKGYLHAGGEEQAEVERH